MKLRDQYTCPLELTHDITRGKWKPIILWQLGKNTKQLSQLERDIKGISQKMLLEQLRDLIEYNIVTKETFEGYPLKVEYSLTANGKKLLQAITIMQNVGIDIMKQNGMSNVLKEKGLLN